MPPNNSVYEPQELSPTYQNTPSQPVRKSTLNSILQTVGKVEQKLIVDPPDQLLNSITLIAGFLVIAAFPLLTEDLSVDSTFHPSHLRPQIVRLFAAISVGLFLMSIIACQVTKLLFVVLEQHHENPQPEVHSANEEQPKVASRSSNGHDSDQEGDTDGYRKKSKEQYHRLRVVLVGLLLELLATAIAFFLLIVAAYAYIPGMLFLVLDGVFALVCFLLLLTGKMGEWLRKREQQKEEIENEVRERKKEIKDREKESEEKGDEANHTSVKSSTGQHLSLIGSQLQLGYVKFSVAVLKPAAMILESR